MSNTDMSERSDLGYYESVLYTLAELCIGRQGQARQGGLNRAGVCGGRHRRCHFLHALFPMRHSLAGGIFCLHPSVDS